MVWTLDVVPVVGAELLEREAEDREEEVEEVADAQEEQQHVEGAQPLLQLGGGTISAG